MHEKSRQLNIHGIFGLFLLIISEILMFMRIEPFISWFYPFAWWSYILIVDSIIYRIKGNSLIMNRTREFFLMIPWSVFIWLFFELINLSMKNWHYINVTNILWIRWIGYGISYGTVLPGIFETYEFLESWGLYRTTSARKITANFRWYRISFGLGAVFLIAPVIFPWYCFPLIWISLIFFLEPIIHKFGGKSLLREWEKGSPRKFYLLLTTGLICGILWEFWNFWANTKWIYTVPFFDEMKIFEMPVLGFLGFPPFAVECYIIYNFISLFRNGRGWEMDNYQINPGEKVGKVRAGSISLLLLAFSLSMFQALDIYTVKSYRSYLADFKLISPQNLLKLKELQIFTANQLLNRVKSDEKLSELAKRLHVSYEEVKKWVQVAKLTRIKGIGSKNILLLQEAGVDSIEELAVQNPEVLYKKFLEIDTAGSLVKSMPTKAMVKVWVRGAQRISCRKK